MNGGPSGGALSGVRVLDLSGLLPGPFASLLLADLGADVIKVETRLGDLGRQVPPLVDRRSAFFLYVTRGKRGLGVNLKSPQGRDVLLDLARRSDVLIESFRPGRMDRMGLGPAAVHAANDRLVYCSISGFGQTGPDAARAGHDATYLARAGILGLSGAAGGPPVLPPVPIADLAAGTNAALAICAALVARERTGRGAWIDLSLLESAFAWAGPAVAHHLAGLPAERGRLPLTGRYPFYNVYPTADGGHVVLAAVEPVLWRAFCDAVGRHDLAARQFEEEAAREAVFAELAAVFAARTTAEWAAFFRAHDLSAEVVADLDTALADPQLAARGMFVVVDHPEEGPGRQVASPLHIRPPGSVADPGGTSGPGGPSSPSAIADPRAAVGPATSPRAAVGPAPDLGADSRAVLAEVLGLGEGAIDALFAAGVVFATAEADRYRVAPGAIA